MNIRYAAILVFLGLSSLTPAGAAELVVNLRGAPADVPLVFQVFDSPATFGDLRDPALEVTLPSTSDGEYRIGNVPSGAIAVGVFIDENANGILDKSFIGIPREPVALSNNYRPKGPPAFDRARIDVADGEIKSLDLEFFLVLGERGRWGVGVGMIGRGNPYIGAQNEVTQAIPAITFTGERLQWLGPTLRYGIAGSGNLRLAIAADYRIGAYEEDDATVLVGMGDRENTLLAGLGVQWVIGGGFELDAAYQFDALDQIGGSQARAQLSRSFQAGFVRISPQVSVNWVGSDLSNHDFGVAPGQATPTRPAYSVGSTTNYEVGVFSFIELTEDWRILINLSLERLDDKIADSPIVGDDSVVKGFAAITYVF